MHTAEAVCFLSSLKSLPAVTKMNNRNGEHYGNIKSNCDTKKCQKI